jgi:hypothetical protein
MIEYRLFQIWLVVKKRNRKYRILNRINVDENKVGKYMSNKTSETSRISSYHMKYYMIVSNLHKEREMVCYNTLLLGQTAKSSLFLTLLHRRYIDFIV